MSLIMSSSFIHVVAIAEFPLFLTLNNIPLYVHTHFLLIHPSVNIQVVSMSWALWIILLNTGVHVTFWRMVFSGYVPRNRLAGSHGSSLVTFLRNLCTVLHSGCTSLRPHPQCGRVPFPPGLRHCLLLVSFLMLTLLTRAGQCLAVSVCISE